MTTTDVQAMVQTGPKAFEMREIKRPAIGDNEALIRVEACAICGSDVAMYAAAMSSYPLIRGHEPVGTIEEIGKSLADSRHLKVGDRVAIDPFIRCGSCEYCLSGHSEHCRSGTTPERPFNAYAQIPLSDAPGLWGGFATHLFATTQTSLYPVPAHVSAKRAAFFNALGNGVKWGVDLAGTGIGSKVAILGAGQRGLACAVAALEAGAEFVAVTGLTQDAHKLKVAEAFGVQLTVDVEKEDLRDAILGAVGGHGVDVVIDSTPGSPQSIADAIALVRPCGRIVVGGMKHHPVDGVPIDQLVMKEVALQGALGTGPDQYRRAISIIANTKLPLEMLQTHTFPLEETVQAIELLAGEVPEEHPINVVVETS
jgi:threonine dehydrogenase-like Zn-dependent dehydrogenase